MIKIIKAKNLYVDKTIIYKTNYTAIKLLNKLQFVENFKILSFPMGSYGFDFVVILHRKTGST